MRGFKIALLAVCLGLSTAARAQSFFFLVATGDVKSSQWISDAPSDAASAGFQPIMFNSSVPRSILITGCRVIAWPEAGGTDPGTSFQTNLSLAIDYGSIGYTTGDPNISGRQVGANFSHNDTLCVQGFEWGKFGDTQQFAVGKPFNRDNLDRLWLALGASVQVAFIYFQITYVPAP